MKRMAKGVLKALFALLLLLAGLSLLLQKPAHTIKAERVINRSVQVITPEESNCKRGFDADGNCMPPPTPEPKIYCVTEGGFNCPADSIAVERIEDVPSGQAWIPTHGGLTDPEQIRQYWQKPETD